MKPLHVILAAALVLRLAYALAQGAALPSGGDSAWYLSNGYTLVTGQARGDIPVDVSRLPTPPVYPLFIGLVQAVLPQVEMAIIAIRVVQSLMSAATCYFAYGMGRAIASERAGLLAAGVLAVSPVMIIETAQVLSETVYVFLLYAALWVYTRRRNSRESLHLSVTGLLLGLATLTRAVLLLYPLGLALHLLLVHRWRKGLKRLALVLAVYSLTVSTWTVWNALKWGRCCIIGGEGFAAFVYIGASGWEGPEQVDENLSQTIGATPEPGNEQQAYWDAIARLIGRDVPGWVKQRVSDLVGAYLQPHGTAIFPGESLKNLAADWLERDRTPDGLLRLAQADWFWPKLLLYVFHYAGIVGGLAGMWLTRHNWRVTLPLVGFILYTTLVHLPLDALPRYLFPTIPAWWIFAAAVDVFLQRKENRKKESVQDAQVVTTPEGSG